MKQLEQTIEKQYKPIEPTSGFPNPYRIILKHILKTNKKQFGKYAAFSFFFPGSLPYQRYKLNDIEEEIAIEECRKSNLIVWNKLNTSLFWGVEIVKPFLYHEIYKIFN